MTLNLNAPMAEEILTPRITVIGVGGAGGNAVNNMIDANLEGVEFAIANTDSQAMAQSICENRIQLGRNITQGLGAGSRPDVGRAAAEEATEEILSHFEGSNMVFITAGMGGGTGTGAAPVIARAAREKGILTVGVVTKPFQFEGINRARIAEAGIKELTEYVDTLIVIPNQNLFRIANEKTTFADAFKMADDVLHSGVRGVTDLMVMPGLINLDFADIRAVMTEMGKAMMGTGEAEGDNRAIAAAEAAISNPLLDDVTMRGARALLINITGGNDMTLFEVDEAANRIRDEVDSEANIIFGSTFDETVSGSMRVSVVATGIDAAEASQPRPLNLSLVTAKGSSQDAAAPAAPSPAPAAVKAEATTEVVAEEVTEAPAEEAPEVAETAAPEAPAAELFEEAAPAAEASAPVAEEAEDLSAETTEAVETAEKAEQDDGAFIAPAPSRPADRPMPQANPGAAATSDPFAAAELANASSEAPKKSGTRSKLNLFARVTGAAKARKAEAAAEAESKTTPLPNRAATQRPATPLPSQPARPAADNRAQPSLTGLDSKDRLSTSKEDEELLDIPAFLRRQAN
ncbi:cell division protein FtsZ [Rhodovibrionaceae bacterium A322]